MKKNKIEIIPAILPRDFRELEEKISMVKDFVNTIQIDICDGQFTRIPTWPYKKKDEMFRKMISQEEGLPGWDKVNFEFDLMVNMPEEVVTEWVSIGAHRIILHLESKGDIKKAIDDIKGKVEIGLALNMETSIDSIDSYIDDISSVQLMGIDNIGFQGQQFDEKVLERVVEVRMKYPDLTITVDGGVSLETAPKLVLAGANRLIVGSAIFESDNYIEAIQKFKGINK